MILKLFEIDYSYMKINISLIVCNKRKEMEVLILQRQLYSFSFLLFKKLNCPGS